MHCILYERIILHVQFSVDYGFRIWRRRKFQILESLAIVSEVCHPLSCLAPIRFSWLQDCADWCCEWRRAQACLTDKHSLATYRRPSFVTSDSLLVKFHSNRFHRLIFLRSSKCNFTLQSIAKAPFHNVLIVDWNVTIPVMLQSERAIVVGACCHADTFVQDIGQVYYWCRRYFAVVSHRLVAGWVLAVACRDDVRQRLNCMLRRSLPHWRRSDQPRWSIDRLVSLSE